LPAEIAAQMAAVDAAGRREAKGYAECLMQAIRPATATLRIGSAPVTTSLAGARVFRRIESGRRCHQRRDQDIAAVVSAQS